MTKIYIYLVAIVSLAFNTAFSQITKQQKFAQAITDIVKAFAKQDSTALAKYTDKATGIYLITRSGVMDYYINYKTITFTDPGYPTAHFRGAKNIKLQTLQYAKLPTFNCNTNKWSKKGLYVDTIIIDHKLSTTATNRVKFTDEKIPLSVIKKFIALENNSRRVVLIDSKGLELIFYLTYKNKNWYVTIMESVTSDCSA